MDVQGSQYHLLNGRPDFGRCTDTTPGIGSGLTLAELLDGESAGLPSSIPTTWEFDDTAQVLRLRRDTPLFRRAGRTDPLDPAQRRGAGRDGYGNWFWIGTDERSIFTQARGSRAGQLWWSADDLATRCSCPRPGRPAASRRPAAARRPALCCAAFASPPITTCSRATGRPARRGRSPRPGCSPSTCKPAAPRCALLWPDPDGFDPWDLADTSSGGALVLDRTHGAYWRLDDHLRLLGTVAATPAGFGPVGGGPAVTLSGPAQSTARLLHDDHGNLLSPVCVEPGPDRSVLVLDADPGRGYSVLYCFDDDVLRWQRPLRDVVEVIDENDPDSTPTTYSVLAHDIAYAVAGGPLGPPLLYLADGEGDQVIAFTLDPRTGVVIARDEFLPLRRWGARALVRVSDGVWYDFAPAAGDDEHTRWVPLQVFTECRFATAATFTTADFGDLPGLPGDTFDSRIPGCAWDRLFLDAHTPAGTAITIRARAADDPDLLGLEPWRPQPAPYLRSGGSELPWADPWADVRGGAREPRPLPDGMGTHELLFQGVLGRYLQLEVTFAGGGRATPLLRSLRAWYPRFSYVDHYLPAVYGENDAPDRFLERYLANFEGLYTALEEKIEHTHKILDPRTARAADLPWLASWFGLVLDPLWDEPRRRFLIRHLDRFYRMRGTVRGLVATLRVYLDPIVDEGVFCSGTGAGGVRVVERFLTRDGVVDDPGHRLGRQPAPRRVAAQEHAPAVGLRPSGAEVAGDRLADVGRQRERLVAAALSVHHQLATAPVEVLQHHRRDLARAQPQPGQQDQDRVVPPPPGLFPVAAIQQAIKLTGRDALRQRAHPPPGRRRHGTVERERDDTLQMAEPQERPQGRNDIGGVAAPRRRTVIQQEPRDVPGPDALPVDRPATLQRGGQTAR